MRIQEIFRVIIVLAGLAAAPTAFANCFDFGTKVIAPLQEALPMTAGADNKALGEREGHMTWGKVRGVVDKPIAEVLALLLDHNNTKSSRVHEMKVTAKSDPQYLARHLVYFKIKP